MTKLIHLFILLCSFSSLSAQSVIFVKANATGSNDGSSWTNAFTSLDNALNSAVDGSQIWVAQGTYKPSTPAPNHSFMMPAGISLYGGFQGVETSLGQRNILVYPTTLSGDINGNDLPGNLEVNREDNAFHVLRLFSSAATTPAIVDGFIIKGGQTQLAATDPAVNRRGAGILVETRAAIRNCLFTENKAESGAGVMASGSATNGLEVYNCRFENNEGTVRAGGIYFFDLNGVEIRKCTFTNNKVVRGCLYPRTSDNVVIDSCLFQENTNALGDGYGTGIFNWQCNMVLSNTQFINNVGGNGVGIYNDNRDHGKLVEMVNCVFEGNSSTDYGGTAVFNWKADHLIDNCIFRNNQAPSSGAAIYNSDSTDFTVTNTLFEGHTGNYAAAIANYGLDCRGVFDNCTFRNNVATNGGGAVSNGFESDVTYKNCTFQANTANFGGAIFTQNEGTKLTIEGGLFTENGAQTTGGAILKNADIPLVISNATFSANSAESGAAILARGKGDVEISDCIFSDNLALVQGAAMDLTNVLATIENCLMVRNLNLSSGGAGGAIINNATDSLNSIITITNCTVADNLAPLGAGLAQYEADASNAEMRIQNTLIQNPDGQNYAIEAGAPELKSNGGNQSSDDSMAGDLNFSKDLNNTVNSFVDSDNGDYHLADGTAAIDGGVLFGATAYDLDGVARGENPETGAYEWATIDSKEPVFAALPLQLMPNPVAQVAVLSLDQASSGKALVEIYSHQGALLRSLPIEINTGNWKYVLPVADLSSGVYQVQVRQAGKWYKATMVKQ
jgi:predicted outer membrane repeat protein